MKEVILILDDIRSIHNVGSLFRTSDGFGVKKIYLCGITPYPALSTNDPRLPHVAQKLTRQIHKTALGAEDTVAWEYRESITELLAELKKDAWRIVALEQHQNSIVMTDYIPGPKTAVVLGTEVTGIPVSTITLCDDILEIPMRGTKESFNVSVAGGITLFWLTR